MLANTTDSHKQLNARPNISILLIFIANGKFE